MARRNAGEGRFCLEPWREWLRTEALDPSGTHAYGHRLTEAQRDQVRWWLNGASVGPTLWQADRFLTAVCGHVDHFFGWCERRGIEAWEGGEPSWHIPPYLRRR